MMAEEFPVWLPEKIFLRFIIEVKSTVGTGISGYESSIEDLFRRFDNLNFTLSDCLFIEQKLNEYGVELSPPMHRGNHSEKRLFKTSQIVKPFYLEEIKCGENQTQEYKSSFVYDRDRALNDSKAKLPDLESKDVLFSFMKSVAGLMNGDGGLLWVGVSDGANQIKDLDDLEIEANSEAIFPGVIDDFKIWSLDEGDFDTFELRIRNLIDSSFWNSTLVNNSLNITFPEIFNSQVCRVEVICRQDLVFLRDQSDRDASKLFVRQGARTKEIKMHEFESYLDKRDQ